MEEECSVPTCKKCNLYNNIGKYCHCAHKIFSLKEQCSRFNYTEECVSHDSIKKKISCNAVTCKTRRKLHFHKKASPTEVQTHLRSEVNMKSDTVGKELEELEKQSKSDQANSTSFNKMYTQDKTIDTYEEKGEQTIPTKDNFRTESSVNSLGTNYVQNEVAKQGKSQVETDENVSNELGKIDSIVEDIYVKDEKIFERIQKDLLNEKRRTKELEKKLKSLTCSLNCLKEDSEQKAACLRDALVTAEEQRKVAMDLVKQSKDQADLVKADRNELLSEISKLQQQIVKITHKNADLLQEHDNLKKKLETLSEDESKRCEEVEKEVNRMKHAVKEKENVLNKERAEFMDMILELTNVINIQKRRICEITGICNNQQHSMHERDKELSQKNIEILEMKNMLQSSDSTFKEMEERMHHLQYCLREETKNCNQLKEELEALRESHLSELRIKDKIVEEQNKTISKQKKLLHDSEEMVQQVASEFNELKDELHKEKERNESLRTTLDETDNKLNKVYSSQCEMCRRLTAEIDYLKKEKEKAIIVAKFAYQKLHQSVKEYQKRLICERQQHRYMALIIEKKEHEIGCLRNQICQNNMRVI
ncbi:hypothetical protein K0M31_006112 [Melipona bicolor]|uniref:Uncharacterized protein n=1 Tax=Melipona bicolor TaxID=60889 RepID=A0AA40KLF4_9HYME|nr:hypothetical protein K0M31_006112 [Melipona bicolor]